jgi:hypothetical protein
LTSAVSTAGRPCLQVYGDHLSPDRQQGRKLLYNYADAGTPRDEIPSDHWALMNYALSASNLVGYLYARRYLPREDTKQLFGDVTVRAREAADQLGLIAYRNAQVGGTKWRHLNRLD